MIPSAIIAACLMLSCSCEPKHPVKPDAPETPTGVTLKSATETTLAIQWNLVDGATAYDWKLYLGSGPTIVQEANTTSRSVIIKNLTPQTDYSFVVRSVNSAASSDYSTPLLVGTLHPDTPVDPPTPGPGPDDDLSARYAEFLIPEAEEDGTARAFPGAEGGGMYATGGRGGKVLHVTSLADTNTEGTLRWAINQSGARTIVFDLAGVIELNSMLTIKNGDLTIAGQTAPGDGICLKNYTFRINASNVIVRYIRCRMGDEKKTADDAIQIMDHDGDKFEKIIIDHCSVSWCTDECASFYGMKDFTFSWNIVSESLRNSVHDKGSHGYGGIWGGTNATYHHNLLAHHDSRNPRLDHDYVSPQKGPLHIFNNVVYNWSGNSCYGGESSSNTGGDYRKYNFFNNYYKPGPATPNNHIWFLEPTTSCSNCGGTILPGHFYMDGNVMHGKADMSANNWSTSAVHASQNIINAIKENRPYPTAEFQTVQSAEAAFETVVAYAGASFARDAIDTRIAKETKDGTYTYTGSNGSKNGLIDTQGDVGGWPSYAATAEQTDKNTDTDNDGIPNWFEEEFGMDKYNAADGNGKGLDKHGRYTNLEMYLHWLVKNITAAGNAGGNYTKL